MKKKSGYLAAGALLVSGIAIACAMKPMPYVGIIDISLWDVAVAGAKGYSNPARAAALKNLDEKAADVVGDADWKANNYIGNVTYKFNNGVTIVAENKPCDKLMKETTPQGAPSSGSTGGGGGSYYWSGGRIYDSGGTCLYGCYGTVGEVEQA